MLRPEHNEKIHSHSEVSMLEGNKQPSGVEEENHHRVEAGPKNLIARVWAERVCESLVRHLEPFTSLRSH